MLDWVFWLYGPTMQCAVAACPVTNLMCLPVKPSPSPRALFEMATHCDCGRPNKITEAELVVGGKRDLGKDIADIPLQLLVTQGQTKYTLLHSKLHCVVRPVCTASGTHVRQLVVHAHEGPQFFKHLQNSESMCSLCCRIAQHATDSVDESSAACL
jgi:hypothetical protein